MSESKHTPGEWNRGKNAGEIVTETKPEWWRDDDGSLDYYGGYLIAESIGNTHDQDLMIAAPDLLAALEGLIEMAEWANDIIRGEWGGNSDEIDLGKARAAVALAKGETE